MYKLFLISFITLSVVIPLSPLASTPLTGVVPFDSLVQSKSPYIVERDIIIPPEKTVVIKPGCVIVFSEFSGIVNNGTLIVDGRPDKPVVFTSQNDTTYNKKTDILPNPFDWNGITLSSQSRGTRIRYAQLCYSVYGIKSQTYDVEIEQSVFSQNGQHNFTINGLPIFIQPGIPYDYSDPEKIIVDQNRKISLRGIWRNHRKPIRAGSLSVGGGGIILGTVFTILAAQQYSHTNSVWAGQMKPDGSYYTDDEVSGMNNEYYSRLGGSVISYCFGLCGMTTFILTLTF